MSPWAEARAAVMLLTRLPMGQIAGGFPALRDTVWAFPLAGLVPGAAGAAVLAGLGAAGLPAGVAATVALAVMMLSTGALHEDGLADCADAMGARDPARRLDILKDSRIGTYGALALIVAVALRVQGYAALGGQGASAMLGLAVASRAPMAVLLYALPPARSSGLGHDAARPGLGRVLVALALGAGCALWLGGLVLVLALVLATVAVGLWAGRALGGQVGDVLGAAQQISEITGLLVLLALLV